MMKPAEFQGQEDPRLRRLDDLAFAITNKVRIVKRAAPKDRPRGRAELRDMLQTFVNEVMHVVDT
jgi:hypothetical protein